MSQRQQLKVESLPTTLKKSGARLGKLIATPGDPLPLAKPQPLKCSKVSPLGQDQPQEPEGEGFPSNHKELTAGRLRLELVELKTEK